jgi:hypothetical protein
MTSSLQLVPDNRAISLKFWQGEPNVSDLVDLTGMTILLRGQAVPFPYQLTVTNALLGEASFAILPNDVLLMTRPKRVEFWLQQGAAQATFQASAWLEPWNA